MPNELGPWRRDRQPVKASRLGLFLWLGLVAGLIVLVIALNRWFPGAVKSDYDTAWTIRWVALVAVMSSGIVFIRQLNFSELTRNLALWLGVVAILAIAYTLKDAFGPGMQSAFVPGYAVSTGPHEVMLSEDTSGGYEAIGAVNDQRVRFAVDTGATDIVLTPSDARRAGIDVDGLRFDRVYSTANGAGRGATTTVDTLSVGPIVLHDVPAAVNQTEMATSLLGMAFLRRLKSFEFSNGHLLLRY